MLEYIRIGSNYITMYSLVNGIGSICAIATYVWLCWKKSKSPVKTVTTTILGVTLLVWGFFLSNYLSGLNAGKIQYTGDIFEENYGGHFLGRVLFLVWLFPPIYAFAFQTKKGEWAEYLDLVCVSLTVQHVFNRIACLCNGCCNGRKYEGPLAFKYPFGTGWGAGFDYSVYPTQVFEIIGMLLLLAILLWRHYKGKTLLCWFEVTFAIVIFLSELMMSRVGVTLYYYLTAIQYAAVVLLLTAAIHGVVRKYRWL